MFNKETIVTIINIWNTYICARSLFSIIITNFVLKNIIIILDFNRKIKFMYKQYLEMFVIKYGLFRQL